MGYYDIFLKGCFKAQNTKPYLVAVAFKEQIQENVPTTEQDVLVDIVLSGQ